MGCWCYVAGWVRDRSGVPPYFGGTRVDSPTLPAVGRSQGHPMKMFFILKFTFLIRGSP